MRRTSSAPRFSRTIDPENVRVELDGDVLTITAEAETEQEIEGGRVERYVAFYRQIPLPEGIDPDQVQTSYENGVLSLHFPKREARSNARQIPIKTTQSGQQQSGQPQSQAKTKERAA